MDLVKPDGYRLRMICNAWYLRLERGTEVVEWLGPFTHAEAEAKAKTLDLADNDRGV